MNTKNYYALTFMAKDSTGIVSSVTKILLDNNFSIDDSSSTLLYGVFSMILIVNTDNDYTVSDVEQLFSDTGYKFSVYKYSEKPHVADGEAFTVSIYGADKAGIVHNITSILSDNGINVMDLQTKIVKQSDNDIYIMLLEVLVPIGVDDSWKTLLEAEAKRIGTDITIAEIIEYEF